MMEGHVLQLPKGQTATVFEFKDLLEIIDAYCGFDVRNVVRDGVRDLETEYEELEEENKDYKRTIECNEEVNRETLLSIRDECDALFHALDSARISRKKLLRITRDIYDTVNAEL